MAGTISSVGIGASGLDVSSIITKLVELEKAPLTKLQAQATLITTRISAYSQIKSLSSTLSDAALKLSLSTTWKAVSVTSSDSGTVKAATSGSSIPSVSSFSVKVQQLARAQSAATSDFTGGGDGTLSIQLGTWNNTVDPLSGTVTASAFAAGSAGAVAVEISPADTVADIATKINKSGAGVTATVLGDASGQRLLVRSNATGEASGFRIQVTETTPDGDDAAGLSRLAFDPETSASGMASAANVGSVQYGLNAKATINNIAVSSTSNTFTDTIPGMTFTVVKESAAPVEINAASDTAAMTKSVQAFVDAYNALNSLIAENTKYDAGNKQATLLQGDSSAIGIQNMLRNLVGSVTTGGAYERLSDIGVSIQTDGALAIDSTKLSAALNSNVNGVSNLFTADNGNTQINGFGVKLKAFMSGLLATTGTIGNRTAALTAEQKRNSTDQTKVNDRVTVVEARLQKQYTALDTKMASLTALNTYITQQVAQWNKSTG